MNGWIKIWINKDYRFIKELFWVDRVSIEWQSLNVSLRIIILHMDGGVF